MLRAPFIRPHPGGLHKGVCLLPGLVYCQPCQCCQCCHVALQPWQVPRPFCTLSSQLPAVRTEQHPRTCAHPPSLAAPLVCDVRRTHCCFHSNVLSLEHLSIAPAPSADGSHPIVRRQEPLPAAHWLLLLLLLLLLAGSTCRPRALREHLSSPLVLHQSASP